MTLSLIILLFLANAPSRSAPVPKPSPTWAYAYALELRSLLQSQDRYCNQPELWSTLLHDISQGRTMITLQVCEVEERTKVRGRGPELWYRYYLSASPLSVVQALEEGERGPMHNRLTWGPGGNSRVRMMEKWYQ